MELQGNIASFNIGEIIHHKRFDYRGVIVDVDGEFSLSDEWYDNVAKSRPPKDAPWYHVLVDGSDTMTYVAQRHLELSDDHAAIDNPLIKRFFDGFEDGHYRWQRPQN